MRKQEEPFDYEAVLVEIRGLVERLGAYPKEYLESRETWQHVKLDGEAADDGIKLAELVEKLDAHLKESPQRAPKEWRVGRELTDAEVEEWRAATPGYGHMPKTYIQGIVGAGYSGWQLRHAIHWTVRHALANPCTDECCTKPFEDKGNH